MGLDHVMLKVKDWSRAKQYYTSALKPLGYEVIADWGNGGGFGVSAEKIGNIYVQQGANVHIRSHLAERICTYPARFRELRRAKPVLSPRL